MLFLLLLFAAHRQCLQAGDICHSNRLVECGTQQGSVVVVPLLPKAASPYNAALYIASHQAGNFSEARKSIVSLAYMLQLVLQPHFQEGGLLTRVWQEQALQVGGGSGWADGCTHAYAC